MWSWWRFVVRFTESIIMIDIAPVARYLALLGRICTDSHKNLLLLTRSTGRYRWRIEIEIALYPQQ